MSAYHEHTLTEIEGWDPCPDCDGDVVVPAQPRPGSSLRLVVCGRCHGRGRVLRVLVRTHRRRDDPDDGR